MVQKKQITNKRETVAFAVSLISACGDEKLLQRDAEPTNNRLLFCAVGRKAFCAVRIIKLDALYLQMIFTEVILCR
jgi:hypothetical protein